MTSGAEDNRPSAGDANAAADSEAAVQEELSREAAEHDAIGGDTGTDRNLSGSSTWTTLGGATDGPAADEPGAFDALLKPIAP
jgi:hypothetical protein